MLTLGRELAHEQFRHLVEFPNTKPEAATTAMLQRIAGCVGELEAGRVRPARIPAWREAAKEAYREHMTELILFSHASDLNGPEGRTDD